MMERLAQPAHGPTGATGAQGSQVQPEPPARKDCPVQLDRQDRPVLKERRE